MRLKIIKKEVNITDILIGIVFTANLIFYLYFYVSDYVLASLNSDSTAAIIKVNEAIAEGSLIPNNWCYATVQDFPLFFAILVILKLVVGDGLITLQIFKILQFLFFVIMAFVFAKKILGLNSKYSMIYLVLLMCPFSSWYIGQIFVEGYVLRLAQWFALVVIGLYCVNEKLNINRKWFALFMAIQFLFVTGEIRFLAIFLAPYLFTILWVWFAENHNQKIGAGIKEIKHMVILIAGTGMVLVVGKLFQKIAYRSSYLSQGYTDASMLSLPDGDLGLQVQRLISEILVGMGYSNGAKQISVEGILSLVTVVCVILLLLVLPLLMTRKYNKYNVTIKRVLVLYWSTWMVEILTIIFSSGGLGFRHVLYTIVMGIGISLYFVGDEILKNMDILALIFSIAIVCFVAINWIAPPFSENAKSVVKSRNEFCDFLKENDLQYGYATYWNAGLYTVWSDMEVQIYPINLSNMQPYYWYCPREFYLPEDQEGRTFFLLSQNEYEQWITTLNYKIKYADYSEKLVYSNYIILVYDYNVAKRMMDETEDIRDRLFFGEQYSLDGQIICLPDGETMFGPYYQLEPGRYQVMVDCEMQGDNQLLIRDLKANQVLVDSTIVNGKNYYEFDVLMPLDSVELFLNNQTDKDIQIKKVSWHQSQEYDEGEWCCINDKMHINDNVTKEGNILLHRDGIVFGPYWDLDAGDYKIKVNTVMSEGQQPVLHITANHGTVVIQSIPLANGENVIPFTLELYQRNVEFVIMNVEEDFAVDMYYQIEDRADSDREIMRLNGVSE